MHQTPEKIVSHHFLAYLKIESANMKISTFKMAANSQGHFEVIFPDKVLLVPATFCCHNLNLFRD